MKILELNKEFFRQLGENDESVLNEYMNQIQQGRLSIKTIANLDLNSKLHLDALANHGFDPVFAISMITEAKQLLNGIVNWKILLIINNIIIKKVKISLEL